MQQKCIEYAFEEVFLFEKVKNIYGDAIKRALKQPGQGQKAAKKEEIIDLDL